MKDARNLVLAGLLIAASMGTGSVTFGQSIPEHAAIDRYDGPATCVACHREQALGVHSSVHYQWTGPTPEVPNIQSPAGKGDKAFNSYCGSVETSRHVACWSCHVSNGKASQPLATDEQLANIDCLTCHQAQYARKPAPPSAPFSLVDYLGTTKTWQLPIEAADGSFTLMPDTVKMGISALDAARTVHRPTRVTCLSCHATAAGSDGAKRGDLSSNSVSPAVAADVHLSPQGANLACQDCHRSQNHHMAGRGVDLQTSDTPDRLTCSSLGCHSATPHSSSRLNTHAGHVACQTCHIPTYAKVVATETRRDWRVPFWATGPFNGQGGYKPTEIKAANLTPTYAWFDGTSYVYVRGQTAVRNGAGQYELSAPLGDVASASAKIYPMKEHWSNSALHAASGQLVPHSTSTYFFSGDFSRAVADGMAWAGMSGSWTLVDVHAWQSLNHGVEPHDNALSCGECHRAYSSTGTVRMDLQGRMGYSLKGSAATVCSQCHRSEPNEGFASVHSKHVTDKRKDCMWCHTFSRPERGLARFVLPGDLNNDGHVDVVDLMILGDTWARSAGQAGYNPAADINHDNTVDVSDLMTLADNWGR